MSENEPIREEFVDGSKRLFIIFGGIAAGINMPPFEFYQSSKILDESRIFVRDIHQSWYHTGLPGISKDIPSTRDHLTSLIARQAPEETVLVGNSMGGFAAILFASLLGNARAVAFAPQTFISPSLRWRHRDSRWRWQIYRTYLRSLGKETHYDLAKLSGKGTWRADIHVSATHRLDLLHARHVEASGKVKVHTYPKGGHRLVKHLRDEGELPGILSGTKNDC